MNSYEQFSSTISSISSFSSNQSYFSDDKKTSNFETNLDSLLEVESVYETSSETVESLLESLLGSEVESNAESQLESRSESKSESKPESVKPESKSESRIQSNKDSQPHFQELPRSRIYSENRSKSNFHSGTSFLGSSSVFSEPVHFKAISEAESHSDNSSLHSNSNESIRPKNTDRIIRITTELLNSTQLEKPEIDFRKNLWKCRKWVVKTSRIHVSVQLPMAGKTFRVQWFQ